MGWKLAFRATRHGRWRTVALGLSAALVTAMTLGAHSMLASSGRAGGAHDFGRLPLYAVLLPLGVLSVTAGRLSAALRQQRAGRLHLLGITRPGLRWVAVGEAGAVALLGWCAGLTAGAWFGFTADAVLVSVLLAPGLLALSAATLPLESRRAMEVARGAAESQPGSWRPIPLALGVLMVAAGRLLLGRSGELAPALIVFGSGAMAVGVLLFLPLLVRMFAGWLVSRRSPVATIAGRRLQAQPGAQTRVLAGLLVSLAVVTGAQGLVATYEDLPAYQGGLWNATVDARVDVRLSEGVSEDAVRRRLLAFPEVRDVVPFRSAAGVCGASDHCEMVLIATCDDLARLFGPVHDCREDAAAVRAPTMGADDSVRITAPHDDQSGAGLVREVPVAEQALRFAADDARHHSAPEVFVPTALLGAELPSFPLTLEVIADPGTDLWELMEGDPDIDGLGGWDDGEFQALHRIVSGARALTYAVLLVGLVSFAMGATDRALERRREVIRLQLVGVPSGTLMRSHWLEVGVPIVIGTALSIGLGWFAADSYAAYAGGSQGSVRDALTGFLLPLTVSAVAGGLLVTALTSLAANPRIRPELIRAA